MNERFNLFLNQTRRIPMLYRAQWNRNLVEDLKSFAESAFKDDIFILNIQTKKAKHANFSKK